MFILKTMTCNLEKYDDQGILEIGFGQRTPYF